MRLQSAIFDMDGTLLDSMPIWRDLGASLMREMGLTPGPELNDKLKTLSLRDGLAYCRELYQLPQTVDELVGMVFDRIHDFYCQRVRPKPGVEKFLSLLKMEGVWMYVATATDRPLAEAALRHAGIDGYFRGDRHRGGGRRGQGGERGDLRAGHAPAPVQQEGHRDLRGRLPRHRHRQGRRVPGGGGVRRGRGGPAGGDPPDRRLLHPLPSRRCSRQRPWSEGPGKETEQPVRR